MAPLKLLKPLKPLKPLKTLKPEDFLQKRMKKIEKFRKKDLTSFKHLKKTQVKMLLHSHLEEVSFQTVSNSLKILNRVAEGSLPLKEVIDSVAEIKSLDTLTREFDDHFGWKHEKCTFLLKTLKSCLKNVEKVPLTHKKVELDFQPSLKANQTFIKSIQRIALNETSIFFKKKNPCWHDKKRISFLLDIIGNLRQWHSAAFYETADKPHLVAMNLYFRAAKEIEGGRRGKALDTLLKTVES